MELRPVNQRRKPSPWGRQEPRSSALPWGWHPIHSQLRWKPGRWKKKCTWPEPAGSPGSAQVRCLQPRGNEAPGAHKRGRTEMWSVSALNLETRELSSVGVWFVYKLPWCRTTKSNSWDYYMGFSPFNIHLLKSTLIHSMTKEKTSKNPFRQCSPKEPLWTLVMNCLNTVGQHPFHWDSPAHSGSHWGLEVQSRALEMYKRLETLALFYTIVTWLCKLFNLAVLQFPLYKAGMKTIHLPHKL